MSKLTQRARGIQSIEIGGRILQSLVNSGRPMMLRDLAHEADIAPAQTHAYLTSLKTVGIVAQDGATGLYRMGPLAMRLGHGWLRTSPVSSVAMPIVKRLADELGVLSLLAVRGPAGPTNVQINHTAADGSLNVRQGTGFSLTGTATGLVFAAFDDHPNLDAEITEGLTKTSPGHALGTPWSRAEFDAAIAETRARGYAVANGNPIPQINAIVVPIFDAEGRFHMSASLIAPSRNLDVSPDSLALRALLATAKRIRDALTPEQA